MKRYYTISELTELFDITPRTLRYYEEVGLVQPERRGSRRIYHNRDRVRIQLILRGRRLGFSLQDIADMLSLYDADPTEVTQLQQVISRGDEKLSDLEAQIRDLTAIRDEILELRRRMVETLSEKRQEERRG